MANHQDKSFHTATLSCENRHFAYLLSQLLFFLAFFLDFRKKAKCRFSQLKVARVNAALGGFYRSRVFLNGNTRAIFFHVNIEKKCQNGCSQIISVFLQREYA